MNMRGFYFFFFTVLVLALWAGVLRSSKISSKPTIEFIFDTLSSPEQTAQVSIFAQDLDIAPVNTLIDRLCRQFSFIDSITIRKKVGNTFVCSISTQKPILKINDDCVLSSRGQLIPVSSYEKTALASIPLLAVAGDERAFYQSGLLQKCARSIDQDLCKEYAVSLDDVHTLSLRSKKRENCLVLISPESIMRERIDQIEKLFDQMASNLVRKIQWIADARFEHQIIFYEGKRGA